MTSKLGFVLALVLLSAVFVAPALAEQSDAASTSDYSSQLDDNSKAVYDELTSKFVMYENSLDFNVGFGHPVLFDDADAAEAYAQSAVYDALTAKYLSDPLSIWLWDFPVTGAEIASKVDSNVYVQGKSYYAVSSVSFKLTVPERYMDDPETQVNEIQNCLAEVKDAAQSLTISGSVGSEVKTINNHLLGVKVTEDEEGKISNIHDALCKKSSSSAGIAAAFTYLCTINNIESLTVKGTVFTDFNDTEKGFHTGYWNVVRDDGKWYAVDVSMNSKDSSQYLMVGSNTDIKNGNVGERFSSTHVADLNMKSDVDLVAPELNKTAYPYPDETPFLEKYGVYIIVALIAIILVAFMLYAVKTGNI